MLFLPIVCYLQFSDSMIEFPFLSTNLSTEVHLLLLAVNNYSVFTVVKNKTVKLKKGLK